MRRSGMHTVGYTKIGYKGASSELIGNMRLDATFPTASTAAGGAMRLAPKAGRLPWMME